MSNPAISTANSGKSGWASLVHPSTRWRIIVLVGGAILHASFAFIVPTVLPSAIPEIGGKVAYAWATTLFLLGAMIGSVAAPALISKLPANRAYQLGLVTFGAGMLCCGLAPSIAMVIIGRFFQGLGGGAVIAIAFSMVPILFEANMYARAIALLSSAWGISALIGPGIAGIFLELSTWRYVFALGIVLSAILCAMAARTLPDRTTIAHSEPGYRWPGVRLGLIGAAALAISIAGVQGSWPFTAVFLAISAASLVLFVNAERKSSHRILPSSVLAGGNPAQATFIAMFLLILVLGTTPYLPYFLGVAYHEPLIVAGYIACLSAIGTTFGGIASASLREHATKICVLYASPILTAIASIALAMAFRDGNIVGIALSWTVVGFSVGIAWPHLTALLIQSTTLVERPIASAAATMNQLAGISFGSAIAGLIANYAHFGDARTDAQLIDAGTWLFALFALPPIAAIFAIARLIRTADASPELMSPRPEITETTSMTLDQLTTRLANRMATRSGLDATLKFDFGSDGIIFVDGTVQPYTVSNENREADCVIAIAKDDFVQITKGELDGHMAFMTGRLSITGNMAIAMKLPSVLG